MRNDAISVDPDLPPRAWRVALRMAAPGATQPGALAARAGYVDRERRAGVRLQRPVAPDARLSGFGRRSTRAVPTLGGSTGDEARLTNPAQLPAMPATTLSP